MGRLNVGTLLSVIAAAGLALGVSSAEARNLETILKDKTIKLGTIPYPPVTTKDPKTNEWAGFWVEGPKLMFEAAGLKVEFVETKWATFPSGLQSDQFDVFVGGAFNTPRRAAAVSFSRPVMYMGHSVTIRKEDAAKFKSLSDIDKPGVTVATVLGTSGQEYMKQNFKNATIKPLDTGDLTQDSLEVLAGRADAALQDAFKVAQVVGRNKEKLVDLFAEKPFYMLPVAYVVSKNNQELLTFVNNLLDWMDTNEKWQESAKNYKDDLGGIFYIDKTYRPYGGPNAQ
jgi:polar amino acid transport system substrate-binding protein